MNKETRYLEIKPGDMAVMLTWQSLDGRICIEHHADIQKSAQRLLYLRSLGRAPKLWADLTSRAEDYATSHLLGVQNGNEAEKRWNIQELLESAE